MWLWAHLSYFPLVNTWETGLKYAWGHLGSSAAGWGSRTCENYEVIYFLSEDVAMAAESLLLPGWPWNEHPHEMDGRAVWVLHEVREWLRNGVRNGWVIGCVLWSYLNGPELSWHWPDAVQHRAYASPVQAHYGTGSIRPMPILFRPIMAQEALGLCRSCSGQLCYVFWVENDMWELMYLESLVMNGTKR